MVEGVHVTSFGYLSQRLGAIVVNKVKFQIGIPPFPKLLDVSI